MKHGWMVDSDMVCAWTMIVFRLRRRCRTLLQKSLMATAATSGVSVEPKHIVLDISIISLYYWIEDDLSHISWPLIHSSYADVCTMLRMEACVQPWGPENICRHFYDVNICVAFSMIYNSELSTIKVHIAESVATAATNEWMLISRVWHFVAEWAMEWVDCMYAKYRRMNENDAQCTGTHSACNVLQRLIIMSAIWFNYF